MTDQRLTLQDVKNALEFSQPNLEFEEDDAFIFMKGDFIVTDGPNSSGPVTRYNVSGLISKDYPNSEPIIIEEGGRIKRTADWHMYANGVCCTCIWEEWLLTAGDISFQAFCSGPLYNFFLSQFIFETTGEWPFGERSHGMDGIVEGVGKILGFEVAESQARRYVQALSAKQVKGHWDCPCGSGKRLRNCHLAQVQALRLRVDIEKAQMLRNRIRDISKLERAA